MEPTKQIGIRVPLSLNERIVALAARQNNPVSATVRRLLTRALEREAGEPASRRDPSKRGEA